MRWFCVCNDFLVLCFVYISFDFKPDILISDGGQFE